MVGPRRAGDRGRGRDGGTGTDRAQLLLIAAIAIAFIVLGVVVVFNSVLYTQTIASDSSIESTTDARGGEIELERGIRGLVREVNRNGGADSVNESLSEYSNVYRNATANSRSALVNVSAHHNETNTGTIVQPTSDGQIEEGNVTNVTNIQHFVIELDSSTLGSLNVTFNDSNTLEFQGNADGNITVNIDGATSCDLEPPEQDDNVTIDLLRGETDANENCLGEIVERINGSYEYIEFPDEENTDGTFELVVEAEDVVTTSKFDSWNAALSVDIVLTYDSSDLSYERTAEIAVYGDHR